VWRRLSWHSNLCAAVGAVVAVMVMLHNNLCFVVPRAVVALMTLNQCVSGSCGRSHLRVAVVAVRSFHFRWHFAVFLSSRPHILPHQVWPDSRQLIHTRVRRPYADHLVCDQHWHSPQRFGSRTQTFRIENCFVLAQDLFFVPDANDDEVGRSQHQQPHRPQVSLR